jgi:hypothetical protein
METIDVMTLVIILIVIVSTVAFLLWLASVPGKVARARGHAQSDAVNVAGWLSLLTCFTTWPFVLVWAYCRPVAVRMADGDSVLPAKKGGAA